MIRIWVHWCWYIWPYLQIEITVSTMSSSCFMETASMQNCVHWLLKCSCVLLVWCCTQKKKQGWSILLLPLLLSADWLLAHDAKLSANHWWCCCSCGYSFWSCYVGKKAGSNLPLDRRWRAAAMCQWCAEKRQTSKSRSGWVPFAAQKDRS